MIVQPGDYITRDGRRVTVREIRGPATACVKGQIWKMFRGVLRPRGYHTWTIKGRYRFIGDHQADLVGAFQ